MLWIKYTSGEFENYAPEDDGLLKDRAAESIKHFQKEIYEELKNSVKALKYQEKICSICIISVGFQYDEDMDEIYVSFRENYKALVV